MTTAYPLMPSFSKAGGSHGDRAGADARVIIVPFGSSAKEATLKYIRHQEQRADPLVAKSIRTARSWNHAPPAVCLHRVVEAICTEMAGEQPTGHTGPQRIVPQFIGYWHVRRRIERAERRLAVYAACCDVFAANPYQPVDVVYNLCGPITDVYAFVAAALRHYLETKLEPIIRQSRLVRPAPPRAVAPSLTGDVPSYGFSFK